MPKTELDVERLRKACTTGILTRACIHDPSIEEAAPGVVADSSCCGRACLQRRTRDEFTAADRQVELLRSPALPPTKNPIPETCCEVAGTVIVPLNVPKSSAR
jgi:hypothetical protein